MVPLCRGDQLDNVVTVATRVETQQREQQGYETSGARDKRNSERCG